MSDEQQLKSTTSTKIASKIREQILSGKLAPATPLREEELAQQYDASRHVIRESLRLLVTDGLAQYSAFKGARVSSFSAEDVHDIYRARHFLETSALSSAANEFESKKIAKIHGQYVAAVEKKDWESAFELDMDFHCALVGPVNCKRVEAFHRELFQSLKLAHLTCPEFREVGLKASVPEHAEIVIAICAGDAARAGVMLEAHILNSERLLVSRITENGKLRNFNQRRLRSV